jgi:hypothetical protein
MEPLIARVRDRSEQGMKSTSHGRFFKMKAQSPSVRMLPEQTSLSAWRELLAQAAPSASQTLIAQQPQLLPRFAAYYSKLHQLRASVCAFTRCSYIRLHSALIVIHTGLRTKRLARQKGLSAGHQANAVTFPPCRGRPRVYHSALAGFTVRRFNRRRLRRQCAIGTAGCVDWL